MLVTDRRQVVLDTGVVDADNSSYGLSDTTVHIALGPRRCVEETDGVP